MAVIIARHWAGTVYPVFTELGEASGPNPRDQGVHPIQFGSEPFRTE